MVSMENEKLAVTCDVTGELLSIYDKYRGACWTLDPLSSCYRNRGADGMDLLRPIRVTAIDQASINIDMAAGDASVSYTLTLEIDYLEIRLAVDARAQNDIEALSLPGSFKPQNGCTNYLIPIMQGVMWDGGGSSFETWRSEGCHTGFSMAFVGFTSGNAGLLLTLETQDDSVWWLGKDDAKRTWVTNIQLPSLGRMTGERVCRIYPTSSSVVDVAKTYRHKIVEQGRFMSWSDKLAERPGLQRLFGSLMCFIGYCKDDIDYVANCKQLVDYGFDRALVYPCRFNTYHTDILMGGEPPISLSEDEVYAIRKLGYDVAPWSWLNEALDDGTDRIRDMYRRRPDGSSCPHWAIDSQQWYQVCSSYLPHVEQEAITNTIPDCSWDHFDVLSCASLGECYSTNHVPHLGYTLSRTEDREFLRKAMAAGRGPDGRAVSSESFNDAYSLELDLGSVKVWPRFTPQWRFKAIPLTMLVYHDSIIHSWWEIHNYNNTNHYRKDGDLLEYGGGLPKLMAANDAIMGCPPDVFPFGAQYVYTGNGHETKLYKYRLTDSLVQEALAEALPVARLHRKIGMLQMVHFNTLSEDGSVQETAFSDGTRVIANLGLSDAFDVGEVGHLRSMEWHVL